MTKIGLVGGIAWRSTADYYAGICQLAEERHRSQGKEGAIAIPHISIESLDLAKAIALLGDAEMHGCWEAFDAYHRDALRRLEVSGADFALIASNTPHHRFDAIVEGVDIPVINIFETVARRAAAVDFRELLILGTTLTMTSDQIRKAFDRHGVKVVCPPRWLFSRISKLIAALQRGEQRSAGFELAAVVVAASGSQSSSLKAVCLACTDFAIAFGNGPRQFSRTMNGITYLDAAVAHIEDAFSRATSEDATADAGNGMPRAEHRTSP